MQPQYSDRYEQAPAEGEYYDPKGYSFLKHFRKWAKIANFMMALMLVATVIGAIVDEEPMPFFAAFFSFVLILGFVGIYYDRNLEEHKKKILNKKIQEKEILLKSGMESNNHIGDTRQTLEE